MLLPGHYVGKLTVLLLKSGFQSRRQREIRASYFIVKFSASVDGINESPRKLSCRPILRRLCKTTDVLDAPKRALLSFLVLACLAD